MLKTWYFSYSAFWSTCQWGAIAPLPPSPLATLLLMFNFQNCKTINAYGLAFQWRTISVTFFIGQTGHYRQVSFFVLPHFTRCIRPTNFTRKRAKSFLPSNSYTRHLGSTKFDVRVSVNQNFLKKSDFELMKSSLWRHNHGQSFENMMLFLRWRQGGSNFFA